MVCNRPRTQQEIKLYLKTHSQSVRIKVLRRIRIRISLRDHEYFLLFVSALTFIVLLLSGGKTRHFSCSGLLSEKETSCEM